MLRLDSTVLRHVAVWLAAVTEMGAAVGAWPLAASEMVGGAVGPGLAVVGAWFGKWRAGKVRAVLPGSHCRSSCAAHQSD